MKLEGWGQTSLRRLEGQTQELNLILQAGGSHNILSNGVASSDLCIRKIKPATWGRERESS